MWAPTQKYTVVLTNASPDAIISDPGGLKIFQNLGLSLARVNWTPLVFRLAHHSLAFKLGYLQEEDCIIEVTVAACVRTRPNFDMQARPLAR